MHARSHQDQVLDFGVSGALWRDAMVMFDRQTGSYWSHVTGECLEGPLAGDRLKPIDAVVMTFHEWAQLHPDSRVVVREEGTPALSRYDAYVESSRLGIFGTQARRSELSPKAIVQGVAVDGEGAAIPHDAFQKKRSLSFKLAGRHFRARFEKGAVRVWEKKTEGPNQTGHESFEFWPSTTAFWFAWINFYPRSIVVR